MPQNRNNQLNDKSKSLNQIKCHWQLKMSIYGETLTGLGPMAEIKNQGERGREGGRE